MLQAIRGRNRQIGYFLRGASKFLPERFTNAVARLVMGILFATERSAAGIKEAIVDSPTASAIRQFLNSSEVNAKLAKLLEWKTLQLIRKALRNPRNRDGRILLIIDSTFKSRVSRLARWLFSVGKGDRSGSHIFVYGILVFPDGRCLPLRPLQKRKGKRAPTQVSLAGRLVALVAQALRGYNVVVLADSFFFSKKLIRLIKASRFHHVIACKGNTVCKDGSSLEGLVRYIHWKRSRVTLPSRMGERQRVYSVGQRELELLCGGRQTVVFSRPRKKKGAKVKFLASDLTEATAKQIVALYARRWQVEVFFRDIKMQLGLDEYRVSGECGPENFAMLVTLAYQFLHWRGEGSFSVKGTSGELKDVAREVGADNVARIERAVLTRHNKMVIYDYYGLNRDRGARKSGFANKARRRGRKAL